MQFSASRDELKKVLSSALSYVPSKATHPILNNFLIAVSADGVLEVTSSNLNQQYTAQTLVSVEEPGSVCVHAKMLTDFVKDSSDDILSFNHEDNWLVVSGVFSKYEFATMTALDFPNRPTPDGETIELSSDYIAKLKSALYAVSTDVTKTVLTTVGVTKTYTAATDGHRLCYLPIDTDVGIDSTLLIPLEVAKALPIEECSCTFNKDAAEFTGVNWTLLTSLIEGSYPQVKQIIPVQFEVEACVDRKRLLSALKRLKSIFNRSGKVVLVNIKDQELILSIEADDVANGEEKLSAQTTGELTFGLNPNYLMEAVSAMNSHEVKLKANSAKTSIVLSPLSTEDEIHLIMPVSLNK